MLFLTLSLPQIHDLHTLEGLAEVHFLLFSLFVNCSAAACVSVGVSVHVREGARERATHSIMRAEEMTIFTDSVFNKRSS